jgi:hypothetical protein
MGEMDTTQGATEDDLGGKYDRTEENLECSVMRAVNRTVSSR